MAHELVSLDDYKEYKAIQSTLKDGKFQALITMISALVENYCNRRFLLNNTSSNSITEWHNAKTNLVILDKFPVLSVISVKTSTDGGLNQITMTEGPAAQNGYFVDLQEGSVFTQKTVDKFLTSFDTPYRSLEIEYTAGYIEVPEDLKLAVFDMVDYYEDEQRTPSKALLGATIDNPLPQSASSWPPHIRRVLDLYRFSP